MILLGVIWEFSHHTCYVIVGLILAVFALFWGMHCRFLSDFGCFCPVLGVICVFLYYIFMFGILVEMNISVSLSEGVMRGCVA